MLRHADLPAVAATAKINFDLRTQRFVLLPARPLLSCWIVLQNDCVPAVMGRRYYRNFLASNERFHRHSKQAKSGCVRRANVGSLYAFAPDDPGLAISDIAAWPAFARSLLIPDLSLISFLA